MSNITMQDLLNANVHFGHQCRYWNPKMEQYIYGVHEGSHIIDLEKTVPMLKKAVEFLGDIAKNNGKILFVGTKYSARDYVKEYAEKCGMFYVNHRWLGGLLTNHKAIRNSIKRLKFLDQKFEKNQFDGLTKKEILSLESERNKLEKTVGGIKNMYGLPDALFIIDVGFENISVKEANKLFIPIVGIVDTVNNPLKIDYVIPGNDDSIQSIKLYLDIVSEAIVKNTTLQADKNKQSENIINKGVEIIKKHKVKENSA